MGYKFWRGIFFNYERILNMAIYQNQCENLNLWVSFLENILSDDYTSIINYQNSSK